MIHITLESGWPNATTVGHVNTNIFIFSDALGLSSLKDVSNLPRVARSVQSSNTKESTYNNDDKKHNKS